MEKLYKLVESNNIMLQFICNYILKVDNPKTKDREDLKNFMTNLVADLYTDNVLGRKWNQ